MALASNPRNSAACLILGAFQVALDRNHGPYAKGQTWAAPDVGQTRTDGSVRLLPGDLGQRLRKRFLEAEPRVERDRIVDQLR